MKLRSFFFAVAVMFLCVSTNSHASGDYKVERKNAVVLAMFGTTIESALQALLNIRTEIEDRFPNTEVRIAFTSNIIEKNGNIELKILSISRSTQKFQKISSM